MKNLDLDFLHSELNRTCEWIKFSDQKSGFVSVYYAAFLGFFISYKDSILPYIESHHGLVLFGYEITLATNIILFFLGLFWLFNSISPRLKNLTTDKSIFYFGHIAHIKFIDYLKDLKKVSETEAKEQIAEQIHVNSLIASQKMKSIQKSIRILFILVLAFSALMSF